ncbi:MAG TPA: LptA/OstA family protein [Dissulfurispiraceae bacterium]|nr:LptA/OstA family protein [Dissulfurispiraceae bacterium]
MENSIKARSTDPYAKRDYSSREFCYFLVVLFLASCFLLQTSASFAEEKDAKKEPVPTVITSDSLTADNKAKTALFMGSVVAKKGDMTLYADRMLVYYVDSGSGNNIDKIEAEGNVKLTRGDRIVTAGKAIYYAGPEERAVFTESPRAIEGKNVVTGTKMTYYMKDDRSAVENSKVFLVEKDQGAQSKPSDKGSTKKNK